MNEIFNGILMYERISFSDENGEKTKQHGSSHPDERKVSGGSYKYVMLFLRPFFCASRVIYIYEIYFS